MPCPSCQPPPSDPAPMKMKSDDLAKAVMRKPLGQRLRHIWHRIRRVKEEPDVTGVARNQALVKFDMSEDFYLKYQCRRCGVTGLADDDIPYTECECGSTDLWVTRGRTWVLGHEKEFRELLETSSDIRVPVKARKWLVGQEGPIGRELMEIARWVYKQKQKQDALRHAQTIKIEELQKMLGPDAPTVQDNKIVELDRKPYRVHFISEKVALLEPGNFLKENPGPYILRISEPGTGKTLASKIIDEEAGDMYRENDIELTDVLTVENIADGQRPLVREVPCRSVQGKACLGPRIVQQAERGAVTEQKNKQQLIFSFLYVLIGLGAALMTTGMFILGVVTMQVGLISAWVNYLSAFIGFFLIGVNLLVWPLFIMMIGGNSFLMNVNRQDLLNTPFVIVEHGTKPKFLHDANVTDSSTLMGSIQWNAYGNTPGLTGPLHKRVVAGIVHRANDLIVSIDEIKNLQKHTAIELLTVMEDGESPIKTRGGGGVGNAEATAITSIATNDPVPADFMLIANGNMDMLFDPNSILNTVKAFFDRFNYGDGIYYETHMDATFENEVKIMQVITDEISRFRLFPMERAGMERIVEYMRSQSDNNKRFKITFRYVIKAILKSFEVALLAKRTLITEADVEVAIKEYCNTIPEQAQKESLVNRKPFKIIRNEGKEYGQINGLAVIGGSAGGAFPVVAQMFPISNPRGPHELNFRVTGTVKNEDSWVADSKQHVRGAILKMYGIDIMENYKTFISFAQSKDVEGPSAGCAMTLALMSLLGDPRIKDPTKRVPIPLRQDVAVTGTVELLPLPDQPLNVRAGTIGGVTYKVQGAADAGCKYVVIPQTNFDNTLTKAKYPCEIFGADSILGYYDLLRADQHNIESLLALKQPKTDEDIKAWSAERAKSKEAHEAPA